MSLEILGMGIIASHFGNSLTATSNLVGLIFLGLSIGYFLGGKLAYKKPDELDTRRARKGGTRV